MKKAVILCNNQQNKRIVLGCERLKAALEKTGYQVGIQAYQENFAGYRHLADEVICVGIHGKDAMLNWLEQEEILLFHDTWEKAEGFYLESCPAHLTVVCGADDIGVLYG